MPGANIFQTAPGARRIGPFPGYAEVASNRPSRSGDGPLQSGNGLRKRSRIIRRTPMRTITAIAANKLGNFLARDFRRIFGSACDDWAERIGSAARSTIECLAGSDALYHNYEHTLQVTIVGRDILHGMMISQRIEPADYSHLIVACLLHDIGYVRGVLSGDTETEFVVDAGGKKIRLARGASD